MQIKYVSLVLLIAAVASSVSSPVVSFNKADGILQIVADGRSLEKTFKNRSTLFRRKLKRAPAYQKQNNTRENNDEFDEDEKDEEDYDENDYEADEEEVDENETDKHRGI